MGKVGTVTLAHTLMLHGLPATYTFHHISHDALCYPHVTRYYRFCLWMRRRLIIPRLLRNTRLRIVTAVREPIGRTLSLYLHAYPYLFGRQVTEEPMERLLERFPQIFDATFNHPLIPAEFFDSEIRQTLGFDVFAHPFDAERGWQIIESEGRSLLILKLERPDRTKEQALEAWLGRRFDLQLRHLAKDEAYGSVYQEFRARVRIPKTFAEAVYRSPFMQHFYTEAERQKHWQRWREQLDDTVTLPAWFQSELARSHPIVAPLPAETA